MKNFVFALALLAPLASHANDIMTVKGDCVQTETPRNRVATFPASITLQARGHGELAVNVDGATTASMGTKAVAVVKNVELQRSLDGGQVMGTDLETYRLRYEPTTFDVFTSARVTKSMVRLVSMSQYDDAGRWPKRSSKSVVECTLAPSTLSTADLQKIVDTVNAN